MQQSRKSLFQNLGYFLDSRDDSTYEKRSGSATATTAESRRGLPRFTIAFDGQHSFGDRTMLRRTMLALAFLAAPATFWNAASAADNKDEVQKSIRDTYDNVIWGGEVTHQDYLILIGSAVGGPPLVEAQLANIATRIAKETGDNLAQDTIMNMLKGKKEATIVGGKTVYVSIATYNQWTIEKYPEITVKIGGTKFTWSEMKIPLPNTHQIYIAIGKPDPKIVLREAQAPPRVSLIGNRIRATNTYAKQRSAQCGFPTYEAGVFGPDGIYDFGGVREPFPNKPFTSIWVMYPDTMELIEKVPLSRLMELDGGRDPSIPTNMIRGVHRYAQFLGSPAGIPTFEYGTYGDGVTYDVQGIKRDVSGQPYTSIWVFRNKEAVEARNNIFLEDLKKIDGGRDQNDPENRIRATHRIAASMGFATGIPSFEQGIVDGKPVTSFYGLKRVPLNNKPDSPELLQNIPNEILKRGDHDKEL